MSTSLLVHHLWLRWKKQKKKHLAEPGKTQTLARTYPRKGRLRMDLPSLETNLCPSTWEWMVGGNLFSGANLLLVSGEFQFWIHVVTSPSDFHPRFRWISRSEVRPRQHASESTQCCCGLCRFAGATANDEMSRRWGVARGWEVWALPKGEGFKEFQKVKHVKIEKMNPIGIMTFEGPLHHSWSICKEVQHLSFCG